MLNLKAILSDYPDCLSNRASFKSILLDKFPSKRREVNIVVIAYECGIAKKILNKDSLTESDMLALIAQLESEYGLSAQYSHEALCTWASAYDIRVPKVKLQHSAAQNIKFSTEEQRVSITTKPALCVSGSASDYKVTNKLDGFFITKFIGFEEDEITIPSLIDGKRIKGIAKEAFRGCVTVKKISISEGIETIEDGAFEDCSSLTSISLPQTLKKIGSPSDKYAKGALASTKLNEVAIPPNIEYIGPRTFSFCTSLKKVELPDKLKEIPEGAFYYCKNLSYIDLPNSLKTIRKEAFSCCDSLEEVHIPLGTHTIEESAFELCRNLKSIYIPPTVRKIDGIFGYPAILFNRMTIYCASGSAAMEYAREHSIKCAKAYF